MKRSNGHERAIKIAVDTIAAEGRLSLISSIPEIASSLQFIMSRSDSEFLVQYMRWRSRTAILGSPPFHSHVVYSYTDERHLVDAVGFYTRSGLDRHAAVILIAIEPHRSAIKSYLKSEGDIDVLQGSGQLLFLDAVEVMSTFMVDGNPDPKLFKAGVKTLIEQASRDERTGRNREIRIFDEMASLLWPINTPAAEQLEEMENEVLAEYSIPILCAYSLNGPGRSQLPESLINAHSHAIAQ